MFDMAVAEHRLTCNGRPGRGGPTVDESLYHEPGGRVGGRRFIPPDPPPQPPAGPSSPAAHPPLPRPPSFRRALGPTRDHDLDFAPWHAPREEARGFRQGAVGRRRFPWSAVV